MRPTTSGEAGGPYTEASQTLLAEILGGVPFVTLTTSCTAALEMTALLANVGPGDEVAVPSFGFVTTALAFVRAGARIRFIDIEPETLGMDPEHLRASITDATRAVVPIHYAGLPAQIGELSAVASAAGATLIEDAAHALTGTWKNKPLGTFGPMATLSFHATKNFSCGEGGALVVNDPALVDRAHVVLEKGTDRRRFLAGEVDKYTWRDLGSSFGMSDFLAAILLEQLEMRDEIQARRRALTGTYDTLLSPNANRLGFRTITTPPGSESAHHLYYVLVDSQHRDAVLEELRTAGVGASFHYVPLHLTPGGKRWGEPADCPVTVQVASSIVRLPLHQSMSTQVAERNATIFLDALEKLS